MEDNVKMVIESRAKVHAKKLIPDVRFTAGFMDRLNEKAEELVTEAAIRAKANGRKGLKATDL